MLYMHEGNLSTKISSNYGGHSAEISQFYNDVYIPMRNQVLALTFDESHLGDFVTATEIFNTYYDTLRAVENRLRIDPRSKFSSSFLEEISCYLFKDIPEISNGTFGIYNKGIYAGLKIDHRKQLAIITKDVDFCIGKKITITIDGNNNKDLILPIVAVEVKTYLDKTMFGEVKSSSKDIRSASPNSKAYVLMGYKSIKDDPIIAARQDSMLAEMFVLRKSKSHPMESAVVLDYWREIKSAIDLTSVPSVVTTPGRLLNR